MKKKSLVSITAAIATAVISGLILYETLIAHSLLAENGLIGIFLAAMFSHLTVIGRGVFVPAFLPLTAIFHPLLLGLSAGLGGAIGEVTTYYWGLGIKDAFKGDEKDSTLSRWIEKYGLIALLLIAATPLPDTPIVILAGSARFPLRKFLIIEAIGKTVWYTSGAAIGGLFLIHLSSFIEEILLSTVIVIASVILCIIVSWTKTREKVLQLLKRLLG